MVLGRYLDTVVGRLYLAVEGDSVVRVTGGVAAVGDIVIDSDEELDFTVSSSTELELEAKVLKLLRPLEQLTKEVMEYMDGQRTEFDLSVRVSGTPFQERVWEALCKIPYGETRTYGELARMVGSPKGARAVGMACNRNPVMLLIPCHRVIGSTGKLVGFGGGLPMKEYLLKLEKRQKTNLEI